MSAGLDSSTLTWRAAAGLLAIETGGCGACRQSIEALRATRYTASLRAHGMAFVSSPRQAAIVLVAGAVSEAARAPLRRVLDAVPRPRAIVAVGNCAIDGCVFAGSEVLAPAPADLIGAHVQIAGCPPSPAQVLATVVRAQRLLASSQAADARDKRRRTMDAENDTGTLTLE